MGAVRGASALLIPLLVAAGCAAGEIAPIDTSSALEIGTGEMEFRPLADGDPLEVVLGPQGGYHVVGNARVVGFVPAPVLGEQPEGMRFAVTSDQGVALNLDGGAIHTSLERQPDGSYTCLPGHHVMVAPPPADFEGMAAEFTVEMVGADGELLIDSRRVVLTRAGG